MEDLLADCSTSDPAPSSCEMGMQYLPEMLCPPTNPAFKPGHQPGYLHQPAMQHSDHGTSPMYLMHQQALQAARDRGYHTGLQQQQPQQPLSSWCRPPDMVPQTMNIGFDEFPSMHQPAPPDVGHRQRRLLSFSQSQQPPPHGQKHFTPKLEPADDMPSVRPTAPSSQPSAVLDQARDLLKFNHNQPKYIPEEQFTRMSAKLFNCTPEHLPHDLKQNLVGLLSCGVNSIEGYIMPGCLQLTVEALVGTEQMEAMQDMSARQAVEQLLQGQNKAFWGSDAMLVNKAVRCTSHCTHMLKLQHNIEAFVTPSGAAKKQHARPCQQLISLTFLGHLWATLTSCMPTIPAFPRGMHTAMMIHTYISNGVVWQGLAAVLHVTVCFFAGAMAR